MSITNEALSNVIAKIEAQQERCKDTAAFCVGEQLKDMARSDSAVAELLDKDLDVESMSIIEAEKKIKAYADSHRKGNCAFVPPKEADRILREFYGLPGMDDVKNESSEQVRSKVIDLSEFL